jgi:hypothetical protein
VSNIVSVFTLLGLVGVAMPLTVDTDIRSMDQRLVTESSFDTLTVPLGPEVCAFCDYNLRIDKDSTVQDANCPQNSPRRKETFHCDRYQCSNGYYYVRIHDGWDWFCTSDIDTSDCPSSSCTHF